MIHANLNKDKTEVQIKGKEYDLIVEMFLIINKVLKNIKNKQAMEHVLKDLNGIAECGDAELYFLKNRKRTMNVKAICIDVQNPEEVKIILKNAIKKM